MVISCIGLSVEKRRMNPKIADKSRSEITCAELRVGPLYGRTSWRQTGTREPFADVRWGHNLQTFNATTMQTVLAGNTFCCTLYQINSNQIKYYIIVRPKVDQRTGQVCLPHTGITKTEKNTTKT